MGHCGILYLSLNEILSLRLLTSGSTPISRKSCIVGNRGRQSERNIGDQRCITRLGFCMALGIAGSSSHKQGAKSNVAHLPSWGRMGVASKVSSEIEPGNLGGWFASLTWGFVSNRCDRQPRASRRSSRLGVRSNKCPAFGRRHALTIPQQIVQCANSPRYRVAVAVLTGCRRIASDRTRHALNSRRFRPGQWLLETTVRHGSTV